ncbi:fatty acyl-AMP ligase [Streptomyces sp. NPDC005648]|uniref:fatty acyl-AMP ligase n=1 Tax=Streptomyces sp. NPDC005648 TaxID=3157044 RepID=UPI0033BBAD60
MTSFRTFTELAHHRAAELAAEDAFVFLPDDVGGLAPEHLTYAALDRDARRIASWLQASGVAGGQVLLLYPSGTDFIRAFLGCLYAGAVAVPAPLPSEQGQHFTRVSGILRDAEVSAVLSDSANIGEIAGWLAAEGMTHVRSLATDTGDYGDPAAYTVPDIGPEHLAFLQYTSGSTSDPKGVMVSHRNLLANEAAIQRAAGTRPTDRFGGWLPFYHDMGLIGHILHPVYLGASAVLLSPISFLRRPLRWLQLFSEYGANLGGGPNFAYDLCVRRITDEQMQGLDLSRWEGAGNGAEPVRAETLKAFADRFAPVGFRPEAFFPCYGMAETTLLVSGTPRGHRPAERTVDPAALEQGTLAAPEAGAASRTLVSSGIVQDFTVKIVDPDTRRERPEGGVGEIWVKGDSVAGGYWKRPETNAEIFDAKLVTGDNGAEAEDAGGWLRTGDLGALDDGQLYITGRLKELVIFSGRNLYPQDVERAVQSTDRSLSMGGGAVFTVETDREHLVVVQEVRGNAVDGDLRSLATGIQRFLGQELQIPAGNVILVRPGTVRRTTSGKIQRTLMRKLFLKGEITPLYEVLEPAVRRTVADATGSSLAAAV